MLVQYVDRALWTLFKVRAAEKRRVLLMALYLLAAVSAFIIGRITRDSLFLSRFDRSALAYNYVTVAFAVAIPLYFYSRVADRFRRDRMILAVLGLLMVLLGLARVGAALEVGWFYFVFYNFIEVFGSILIIQFWTFASDLFSSREAKRLFPLIGGGGVLANLACGPPVAALTDQIGTANLMYVQIILLAVCALCVMLLARDQHDRLVEAASQRKVAQVKSPTKQGSSFIEDLRVVFRSKHLQIVAALTCITFISVQFIDFSFKDVVSRHYQGDMLTKFFANFYAVSGAAAAVIQFLITRRLLERFGVVVALALLPLLLFGGAVTAALTFGALWAATLAKGTENSLRYSVYDATMQVLYTAVPAEVRGRAKALIDGNLKPIASGLAGGLLLLMVRYFGMPPHHLYWVSLGFLAIWLGLVLGIKREYVRQLMATLRKRRLNFEESSFEITDARTIEVLQRALRSEQTREVLNALELVPRIRGDQVFEAVAGCTAHTEAQVRQTALRLLADGSAAAIEHIDLVTERFLDEDDEVRAEAIRTFCSLVRERALQTVRRHLSDSSPLVRAASVAGLMRHGGLDGILTSADEFKAMMADADPLVRQQAARVLAEIQVRNFFQPVLELMQDPVTSVQLAAIAAAGAMQSPELIPVLVYKLAHRETARAAQIALIAYGGTVAPTLAKVLAHEDEELAIRRQVPRILGAIGDTRCLEILLDNLGVRDGRLRWEVARASGRLRDRSTEAQVPPARVKPHLITEVQLYYQTLAALADIGGLDIPPGVDLLSDAMRERLKRSIDRIFRFLAILYPLRTVELVYRNLESPSKVVRSNATELLDNLLEKDLGRLILPIIDEGPIEQKIQFGETAFDLQRRPRHQWLEVFLGDDDTWLRVCALYDIGETGLQEFVPQAQAGLADPDPLVRETAVRALSVLVPPEQLHQHCAGVIEDRDKTVQSYTRSLLGLSPKGPAEAEAAAEPVGPSS